MASDLSRPIVKNPVSIGAHIGWIVAFFSACHSSSVPNSPPENEPPKVLLATPDDSTNIETLVAKRCGADPWVFELRTVLDTLNETTGFSSLVKSKVRTCAEALGSLGLGNVEAVKTHLQGCLTKEQTVDPGVITKLVSQVDKVWQDPNRRALATKAHDACHASVIECRAFPCPACGDGNLNAPKETCDEGALNGTPGRCRKDCGGKCGAMDDACCPSDAQTCVAHTACILGICRECGTENAVCCAPAMCDVPLVCSNPTGAGVCQRSPPPPPPVVSALKLIIHTGKGDNKDDDTYARVQILRGNKIFASWSQDKDDEFNDPSDRVFPLNPPSLQEDQLRGATLKLCMKPNGKDHWYPITIKVTGRKSGSEWMVVAQKTFDLESSQSAEKCDDAVLQ